MTEDEMVDGIASSMDMSLSQLQGIGKDREVWSAAVHGIAVRHDEATEKQPQMQVLRLSVTPCG